MAKVLLLQQMYELLRHLQMCFFLLCIHFLRFVLNDFDCAKIQQVVVWNSVREEGVLTEAPAEAEAMCSSLDAYAV